MSRVAAMLLVILCTSGCAAMPAGDSVDYDPWEKMNRSLYQFNDAVDSASLKPIAKGYKKVLPEPIRNGVTNFGRNLGSLRNSLNNFLQGKPDRGFSELARFAVNSTVGVGGLIDIATATGVEAYPEDFGQTAAVWGVPSGPYVMVPFLGPQTLRHLVLLPADIELDVLHHVDNSSVRDRLWVLRTIDLRHRVLSLEDLMQDSKDPYVTLRESYLQNRKFEIYDGNPPVEDEDEFYDEFLEDEDY
jgi:phospholipid-binding lipoprotein MlaA